MPKHICIVLSSECGNHTYGLDCQHSCGNCSDGAPCHHISGICPNGCNAGVFGKKCDKGCNHRLTHRFFFENVYIERLFD